MRENRKDKFYTGLVMIAIGAIPATWQIYKWISDGSSYWIIWRIWFIPLPLIVIAGLLIVGGLWWIAAGIFNFNVKT
jgi:hypothetical protein